LARGVFQAEGAPDLDAPISGRASLNVSETGALLAADADLRAGRGEIGWTADGERRLLQLESARLQGSLDPAGDAVVIDRASYVLGDNAAEDISGRLRVEPAAGGGVAAVEFDLAATGLSVAVPGKLPEPVTFERASGLGRVDVDERRLSVSQLSAAVFDAVIEGDVAIRSAPEAEAESVSPAIEASLTMDGSVTPDEVLRFWPIDFGLGARDWIDGYLHEATLTDVRFEMALEEGAVTEFGHVPDEQMRVEFKFRDARIDYFPGLTELTDLEGEAVLTGDSFQVRAPRGKVGDIALSAGEVDMPKLNPKGQPAYFRGTGEGATADILALLDMEPLGFVSDFGLSPRSVDGTSVVDFEFSRPLRRSVPLENVGYKAEAKISDFGSPDLIVGAPMEQGALTLSLDKSGIVANGDVVVAGAPVRMTWVEEFFVDGPSTTLEVNGVLDAALRDSFGFATRSFLTGPVGVRAVARGEGVQVSQAEIYADFADAELDVSRIGWLKPEGEPASAVLTMS
ncbi:MAG: DUF3971 domain-containing protein, partial [Pseudomonadota bacterium]